MRTGIKVTRPLDFSIPNRARRQLFHYTDDNAVNFILNAKGKEVLGGVVVNTVSASLFTTSGSGTFNAGRSCVYCAAKGPAEFKDDEAIAANNYGTLQHRKEKYGEGGEMEQERLTKLANGDVSVKGQKWCWSDETGRDRVRESLDPDLGGSFDRRAGADRGWD